MNCTWNTMDPRHNCTQEKIIRFLRTTLSPFFVRLKKSAVFFSKELLFVLIHKISKLGFLFHIWTPWFFCKPKFSFGIGSKTFLWLCLFYKKKAKKLKKFLLYFHTGSHLHRLFRLKNFKEILKIWLPYVYIILKFM